MADPTTKSLEAEPADLEPQLERPEPTSELRGVLVVVPDRRLPVEGSQVLRHEAERRPQRLHSPRQEQRRIERREEPLVRVDDDRIGSLPAAERLAQLRRDRDGTGVGSVDVEP